MNWMQNMKKWVKNDESDNENEIEIIRKGPEQYE